MLPMPAIRRNGFILAAVGLVTTACIAVTFQGTRDIIAEQERQAQARALLEIVPNSMHDNDMLEAQITLPDIEAIGLHQKENGYLAKQQGEVVAVLLPVIAREGYSGDIRLLIGINSDGSLAGVRALSHHETPGLGDKVELKKSPWILSFNGKSLNNPSEADWKVSKDGGEFDTFTGATITPRAVTKAVKNALVYFEKHKATLIHTVENNQ
jgi:electron transport complex protein RnfG